ncbi:MAG: hypothetical protein AB7O96_13345 [Pseudobdellovibrionaceae bacterium]
MKALSAVLLVTTSLIPTLAFAALQYPEGMTPEQKKVYQLQVAFKTPPNFRGDEWKVTKTEWTTQDEAEFSQFIVDIYKSGCKDVDDCIKGSGNKYYKPELEKDVYLYADCGRSPLFFRAYFAWKKGLPFSFVDKKTGNPEDVAEWMQKEMTKPVNPNPNPNPRDFPIRYTKNGNIMQTRLDIPFPDTAPPERRMTRFYQVADYLFRKVESGNYRFDYTKVSPVEPDFYSVRVQKGSIRPGTTYYDPNGHILMVAEILSDGRIRFIDSHPGNSVSRPTFGVGHKFGRPATASGFKNHRPVKLVNARKRSDGSYAGGQVVPLKNDQIYDFSPDAMWGTIPHPNNKWSGSFYNDGSFEVGGTRVGFHEWVELSLSQQSIAKDPIVEFRNQLTTFCDSVVTRQKDVADATEREKLHLTPHPVRLPKTVHDGLPEIPLWYDLSSPARDLRTRLAANGLMAKVKQMLQRHKSGSALISYSGTQEQLRADLLAVAEDINRSCQLGYTNSKGQNVPMTIMDVIKRAPKMSFDPYHCPERRWGATNPAELATCEETADSAAWYEAQQIFRNKLDTEALFDDPFTLQDLQKKNAGRAKPDLSFDLERMLRN